MTDLLFVLIVCGFFGVAALLVRACDRIIGPDEAVVSAADQPDEPDEVAA